MAGLFPSEGSVMLPHHYPRQAVLFNQAYRGLGGRNSRSQIRGFLDKFNEVLTPLADKLLRFS